jgi:hypothetical protein
VIRNAAAMVVLAYVLELLESSIMSLRARRTLLSQTQRQTKGFSERQDIMERGAVDARADRSC